MKTKSRTVSDFESVWIIIPAYEEEKMIGNVIEGLKKEGYNQILVVDDGSQDKTAEIAKKKEAIVVSHRENSGLGASIRTGLKRARSRNAEIVITFDADGQHDPKEIKKLLNALNDADIAVGKRDRQEMPLNKRLGNAVLDLITHFLGGPLTDSQSGFRAFGPKTLEKIQIWSDRYSVSSEIIVQAGRKNLNFKDVPIKGIFTQYSKASGTTIASGIKIVIDLLKALALSIEE
ncbi:hypothetical protein AKJ50_00725 [candidate division MSBL1 archaeon SCGC-AAA382A13]|uniref:Glycosyltransferase 2-like domain-containing protein n=2 Tax=candidate division MSBL1 TaxID=215777 RepID=A0A133VG93_9EURY|nr:hypothetical protein AKJ49_00755 [candidate division MSBL1 archaeon SCGC-AAA382A03]KXB05527.1 hypothetical protein AKJ50_00725 [candidate division MSBL1 archaeon SCGC-AAA382A13]